MIPKVSIVIPTYNEQENIVQLLAQIFSASDTHKQKFSYEAIVVDDGNDNTKKLAKECGARIVQGYHKGLGQAIIDGIIASQNEIVVVMDADLSHSPHSISDLIKPIVMQGYDMTIGSRYVKGGDSIGWETSRKIISRCACLLALPITNVKDSTSGFFAFRKELLQNVRLQGNSWKIMLEILVKCKPIKVYEVPIQFKVREKGKSKFNKKQMIAYLTHLFKLALFKYSKFVKFCIVGGSAALITFGVTWILTEEIKLWYMASLVIATAIAMVFNFTLSSIWTFAIGKNMNDADYEWNAYYKGNVIQKWWKHKIVKYVREMVTDKEGQIILDYGCGSSPIASELGKQQYFGIDTNEKKIEYVGKKLPYVYYTKIPNSFDSNCDVSMAIEVIEHMSEISKAHELIKMLRDKTKINGTVIIATPDYNSLIWKTVEFVYGKLMPNAYASDHKVRFEEQELIEVCLDYGLEHVETKRVAGCDMVCKFRKLAISEY